MLPMAVPSQHKSRGKTRKMNKKTKKKIIKISDNLLSYDPINTFGNLIYGVMIAVLFFFIFMGIRLKLLEGYFQYMIFLVMLVFCIREADRHFSKLHGLWFFVGMGIFVHCILLMLGYETAIYQAVIQFSIFIVITSIIYHLGFRKYLIKKLRLTEREVRGTE